MSEFGVIGLATAHRADSIDSGIRGNSNNRANVASLLQWLATVLQNQEHIDPSQGEAVAQMGLMSARLAAGNTANNSS